MIVVTHDVDEAAGLADRIAVLLYGGIVQDAAPSTLLTRPVSVDVARFLGIPNIVTGKCDGHGMFSSALGVFPVSLAAGDAALVGRPDAFVAHEEASDAASSLRASSTNMLRGTVTEVRERTSGGLVVVTLDGDDGVRLLAQRGGDALRAGSSVHVHVMHERVHVVRLLYDAGQRDV